jgi:hypothetical protein
MLTRGCLLLLLSLTLSVGSAKAAHTSFGANYGLTIYHPKEGGNTMIIGFPAAVSTFQPGIRMGASDEKMQNELYFDTGFSLLSGGGTVHAIDVTANYQHTFPSEKLSAPYVTAGIGAISVGADGGFGGSANAVSAVFGAGLGMRTKLQNGHGAFRIEARVDHITGGKDRGTQVIDQATLFGLKGGFDIWVK